MHTHANEGLIGAAVPAGYYALNSGGTPELAYKHLKQRIRPAISGANARSSHDSRIKGVLTMRQLLCGRSQLGPNLCRSSEETQVINGR